MRIPTLAALFLSAAVSLHAQSPAGESIEVRVVNVDVVVTDRSGAPVTGLTRDDFEIFEDGRKRTITNFYEVSGTAAPAAATGPASTTITTSTTTPAAGEGRARRFFLFVDVTSLHPATRDSIVASLQKFVAGQIQPGDQTSVVAWTGAVHVLAPLSGDKSVISAAVEKVRTLTSTEAVRNEVNRVQQLCSGSLQRAKSGQLPMILAYQECIGQATSEAMATSVASRRLINALDVTLAMMSGIEGKKVLVVAGARLPKKPGFETFNWANATFSPYLTGFNAPRERYKEDHPVSEAVDQLARDANAAGVTMYLINAPSIADPMNAANSEEVTDGGTDFLHGANTGEAYADLARGTGGVAVSTRSNFDSLFTAIGRDLGAYYSLGYRPTDRSSNARKIEVRTKNRAHTVRARQTFTEKTFDDQVSDRVVANIFNPTPNPEWPIRVRTGKPAKDGANIKVPVEVEIPSSLTLLPQGQTLDGGFIVYIAVGDNRGAMSTVSRSPQVVSVPVAEEKAYRSEPMVFTADLTVRPGENIISVGVVDRVANTTSLGRAVVTAAAE